MRAATLVLLALLVGCKDKRPSYSTVRVPADTDYFAADPADSALAAPRLVTGPTVVVFWLPAADTLHPDDAAGALDDMNYYTERLNVALARWGVSLLPTNSDTVYIALPNNKRRSVLLSGLDYPFGYVIAEPGGVERVLPGVYTDEELLDEVRVYFDLSDDSTVVAEPKVISD